MVGAVSDPRCMANSPSIVKNCAAFTQTPSEGDPPYENVGTISRGHGSNDITGRLVTGTTKQIALLGMLVGDGKGLRYLLGSHQNIVDLIQGDGVEGDT